MSRADRRRAARATARPAVAPPRAAAAPVALPAWLPRAGQAAFAIAAVVFLTAVARALEARITWYLAVDQFGYLQFAHDLLHGKVFHDWPPMAYLAPALPPRTDVLAQTYVWDHGRLYCRYAPGFPMLVAAWLAVFGDERVPYLNPTVYLALLAVLIACQWRLARSAWRGLVMAVIAVLCPTRMYWWSLTLTRDLSAHLFAFIGFFLLLPSRRHPHLTARRAFAALVPLGFCASIRNDGVLYLIPAAMIVLLRWWRERPGAARMGRVAGAAFAGVVLGLLPTLAFNAAATGNPFRPTQGMEIEQFLPSAPPVLTESTPRVGQPSPGWHGGVLEQVQGGGLRVEHVWRTLPGNWLLVQIAYGPTLLALAALGAVVAIFVRPLVFAMAVPYGIVAFVFFSFWARPDARYIIGVFLFLSMLVTEGIFGSLDLVRRVARRRGRQPAQVLAAGMALAALGLLVTPWHGLPMFWSDPFSRGALDMLAWLLPAGLALGATVAALVPQRRMSAIVGPVLGAVLVALTVRQSGSAMGQRAPFQMPQVTRARATFSQAVEPNSVVITTEDIGRPAENIEYYGGVPSLYLTDLQRWNLSVETVALLALGHGVRPYLLIDEMNPAHAAILAALRSRNFVLEPRRIAPYQNLDHFVAAPFHSGRPLVLYRISAPPFTVLRQTPGAALPGP